MATLLELSAALRAAFPETIGSARPAEARTMRQSAVILGVYPHAVPSQYAQLSPRFARKVGLWRVG
jgi:hypothetical protein